MKNTAIKYPPLKGVGMTTVIGVVVASTMVIGLSTQQNKWAAGLMLACIAVFSSFIILGRLQKLIFYSAIFFSSPISIDVYLWRKDTPFIQLHGFPLTIFDILFAALLGYWFIELLTKKKTLKIIPYISIPLLACIALAFLSVTQSVEKGLSICALLVFIKCMLIFIYFVNNFDVEKDMVPLLWILVCTLVFQSLIGLAQYASGSTLGLEFIGESQKSFRTTVQSGYMLSRVGGTIGSANGLAMFLNGIIPILFCALFTKVGKLLRISMLIAILMACMTEVLTSSRGGWVSLAVGVMIASFIIFKHRFNSRLKSALIITLGASLVGLLLIGFSSTVQKRLLEDNYKSAFGRLQMATVAVNIIKANPLTGIGINEYTTKMQRYDRTPGNITHHFPYPVHNAFLLFAAECGLIALVVFLIIPIYVIKRSLIFFSTNVHPYSLLGLGFYCGFLTWLIHCQFEPFPIYRAFSVWLNSAFIIALSNKLKESK